MKQQKKFYVIYQITNNLNGKIYIGKHKTNNLDDDYMGSGKILNDAFKKYSLENFTKTILFYLQNEDEMNLLEKMVVTKEFCDRDDTYNLNVGGDGGWSYANKHHNNKRNHRRTGYIMLDENGKNAFDRARENYTAEQFKDYCQRISDGVKEFISKNGPVWLGKHHTEETKRKIGKANSISQSSKRNSQYGTRWICNDLTKETKKILKTDSIPDGWRQGRIYKK